MVTNSICYILRDFSHHVLSSTPDRPVALPEHQKPLCHESRKCVQIKLFIQQRGLHNSLGCYRAWWIYGFHKGLANSFKVLVWCGYAYMVIGGAWRHSSGSWQDQFVVAQLPARPVPPPTGSRPLWCSLWPNSTSFSMGKRLMGFCGIVSAFSFPIHTHFNECEGATAEYGLLQLPFRAILDDIPFPKQLINYMTAFT